MEELFAKLKEAAEAKAYATQQEAIAWQKLATALDAYRAKEARNRKAFSDFEQQNAQSCDQTLLTTKQAAKFLGMSPASMNTWRTRGGGPVFIKIGQLVRYKLNDLIKYADENSYPNTSAYDLKK